MFSDILATIIAFISIILLLSIVVTAMVQTSQAILRLRSRNLMKGLASLLMNARGETLKNDKNQRRKASRQAKKDASEILNSPNIALIQQINNPTGRLNYFIRGPLVSWIDPKELPEAMERVGVTAGDKDNEEFVRDFEKSKHQLSKRFLVMTRGWSFAWAFIVAFVFQVNAPVLFSELSTDAERRDRIVGDAEQIVTHSAEALAVIRDDLVAEGALKKLADNHENYREHIEEAIGIGTTREFLLEELRFALEDVQERETLIQEYDTLLNEALEARRETTREKLDTTLNQLQEYDIAIWPYGIEYYYKGAWDVQWKSVIGVLITAILLSLGGSFWYEQLRNVLSLRDTLAGKTNQGGDQNSGTNENQLIIKVDGGSAVTKQADIYDDRSKESSAGDGSGESGKI